MYKKEGFHGDNFSDNMEKYTSVPHMKKEIEESLEEGLGGILRYLNEAFSYGYTSKVYEKVIVAVRSVLRSTEKEFSTDTRREFAMEVVELYESTLKVSPSKGILDVLSDIILFYSLEGNTDTYKMQNEEYPILSKTQYDRRTGRRGVRGAYEVGSIWLDNLSNSNRNM